MTGKRTMVSKGGISGKRGYGWVPDVPDQRDYLLSAVLKVPARLPSKVDLRPLCSKVEDQGQLGSCTANALAGAIEFLERKDKVPFKDFSRLFIYYNERVLEHSINSDSGAMIRDGIKTMAKQGVAPRRAGPMRYPSLNLNRDRPAIRRPWNIKSPPITVFSPLIRCGPVWPKGSPLSLALPCMRALKPRKWPEPVS